MVERFQTGQVPIFLISLKAGGVGLNLTAADTVIHYDPWWNPAVEDQATDRAHRIGQDQKVFVYRLLTEQTVEQKVFELQQSKRGLGRRIAGWRRRRAAQARMIWTPCSSRWHETASVFRHWSTNCWRVTTVIGQSSCSV